MTRSGLPPAVVAFISACIGSLEDLSVLVTLVEGRDRWWDADRVAERVGLPPCVVRHVLERFLSLNLLDVRVTEDLRYRFRPGTIGLEESAHAFANEYRRAPATVRGFVRDRTSRAPATSGRPR